MLTAASLGPPAEPPRDARAPEPEYAGERQKGGPTDQFREMDRVRARLRHARGEKPSGPKQEHEAARGRHGEDAERELGYVSSRVPPDRVQERRPKRRRIQRVGDADRDDECDEGEHRPSLTDGVR